MKKLLKFSAYPLTVVLAAAVNAALFFLSTVVAISFMQMISMIIYVFLGGIVLHKINDKKIRNYSLIFTTILVLAGGIACAVGMYVSGDTAVWAGMIIFPLSTAVTGLLAMNHYLDTLYLIIFAVSSVFPILISYLASLIFGIEKKKLKSVLIAVMALICVGSAVKGAVTISELGKDSIYENGEFYNAYYDINGNKYESNEDVPYYDKNGKVYYQTYNHPVEEYSDEWYAYVGEMTDENGNEYNISDFYVYADGYVFMDKDNSVDIRDDLNEDTITDWAYVDSDGNICGQVLGVSYTRDGEPYFGMGDKYKTK